MKPAKLGNLGYLGSKTQVSWVLEYSEPSSKVLLLWQQTQQTQLKPGFLFILMNPAKLGKLSFQTQLTWVTCSLGSPRLAGFWNPAKTQVSPGLNPAINTRVVHVYIRKNKLRKMGSCSTLKKTEKNKTRKCSPAEFFINLIYFLIEVRSLLLSMLSSPFSLLICFRKWRNGSIGTVM